MQIKFNNVLLAGTWEASTSQLSRELGQQVQRADYLRGSQPTWFNRGNYVSTISFSSNRVFDSIVAAELFFLEHGDNEGTNSPTNLVGVVEFDMDDGQATATRYAKGNLKIRIEPPIGVHIVVNYTLEYGRLQKDTIAIPTPD